MDPSHHLSRESDNNHSLELYGPSSPSYHERCLKALENIYIKGYFYSKAGVIFSDLKPKDHYEKNLFFD